MNSKIQKFQHPLTETHNFTRCREIGQNTESLIASILINYLDNMLLSMPTEYFSPQFLIKHKSKYFPIQVPHINVYLAAIENSSKLDHNQFAKALNSEIELINEFMNIGIFVNNNLKPNINDWISDFCKDLNVNVNIYNENEHTHSFLNSRYTQALVLSILIQKNDGGYGVIYHEKYSEFDSNHFNLSYNTESSGIKFTELQEFEVYVSKSLDLLVKEQIPEGFSGKMNEIYYKIKLHTRKFCLFDERMNRIGKLYLGNIEKCSFCLVGVSAIRLECSCFLCYECVNAYQPSNSCPSCSTPFSNSSLSLFNSIKSTFT